MAVKVNEMKKTYLIFSSAVALLGSAISYYIGVMSGYTTLGLILTVINGAFLGYLTGLTLFWKKYGALIWGLTTLLVAMLVHWLAGSTVALINNLGFATMGIFVVWNFWSFRKHVLLSGLIGGIIGFIWGMNYSYWFGNMQLEPGLRNAGLLSVQFVILAMALGKLYLELTDWQPRSNDLDP